MLAEESPSSGDGGWIIIISTILGIVAGLKNRTCARVFHRVNGIKPKLLGLCAFCSEYVQDVAEPTEEFVVSKAALDALQLPYTVILSPGFS